MTANAAYRDFWRSVCLAEADWIAAWLTMPIKAWPILVACDGYAANFDNAATVRDGEGTWRARVEALDAWAGAPSPESETLSAEYADVVLHFWRSLTQARAVIAKRYATGAQWDAAFMWSCALRCQERLRDRQPSCADCYARARYSYDRWRTLVEAAS